ncbi:CueP family metal-binding protein [Spirochaeta dissipatitropha]
MKRRFVMTGSLTVLAVLGVLTYTLFINYEAEALILRTGSDLDGPGLVSLITEWTESRAVVQSWVDDVSVNAVFPDGERISFPLDEDRMYIAVAPFLDMTHPCDVHYLSSCSGELKNRDMNIVLINEDGDIVQNSRISTARNGFFEIWIDRDAVYTLEIEMDGAIGSGTISGTSGSRTCVTDIQLVQSEQNNA